MGLNNIEGLGQSDSSPILYPNLISIGLSDWLLGSQESKRRLRWLR